MDDTTASRSIGRWVPDPTARHARRWVAADGRVTDQVADRTAGGEWQYGTDPAESPPAPPERSESGAVVGTPPRPEWDYAHPRWVTGIAAAVATVAALLSAFFGCVILVILIDLSDGVELLGVLFWNMLFLLALLVLVVSLSVASRRR